MIKFLHAMALAGVTGIGGYAAGNFYPAPPEIIQVVNKEAAGIHARMELQNVDFAGLRSLMPKGKFDQMQTDMNNMAAAAGEVIVVEHDSGTVEEQLDNLALETPVAPTAPASPSPAPANPATSATPSAPSASATPAAPAAAGVSGSFEKQLLLCPRMTIQNSPPAGADLVVAKYAPVVNIKGVKLAVFPVHGACMSSGFGTRSGRLHKGLDYHNEMGAPIVAAGDGSIIEMKYRDDYGNMLLIDHGGGVYTRYAHLASFGKGLSPGVTVRAGDQIGLMGNTASYAIPMHLHYEVLLGDYSNPKASFGLEPVNPMTYPAAN
jgi:murein DD-endopeptidase MepM/ murein hydrolase activator NlpD